MTLVYSNSFGELVVELDDYESFSNRMNVIVFYHMIVFGLHSFDRVVDLLNYKVDIAHKLNNNRSMANNFLVPMLADSLMID